MINVLESPLATGCERGYDAVEAVLKVTCAFWVQRYYMVGNEPQTVPSVAEYRVSTSLVLHTHVDTVVESSSLHTSVALISTAVSDTCQLTVCYLAPKQASPISAATGSPSQPHLSRNQMSCLKIAM